MSILGRLIPSWVILLVVAAGFALAGLQTVRLSWAQATIAELREDAAVTQRDAEKTTRVEETRLVVETEKAVDRAQPSILAESRDAFSAGAAVGGVQRAALATAARSCPPTRVAAASAPAADPRRVLADVLGEVVERSRILAEEAGKRGTAGTLCQAISDGQASDQ